VAALQLTDPLSLSGRGPGRAVIDLGLADPLAQRLGRDLELLSHRTARRPLHLIVLPVLSSILRPAYEPHADTACDFPSVNLLKGISPRLGGIRISALGDGVPSLKVRSTYQDEAGVTSPCRLAGDIRQSRADDRSDRVRRVELMLASATEPGLRARG